MLALPSAAAPRRFDAGKVLTGFSSPCPAFARVARFPIDEMARTNNIGGAGAPGARQQWLTYGGTTTNRPDNVWVKLPR